jgi:hypothetical protein
LGPGVRSFPLPGGAAAPALRDALGDFDANVIYALLNAYDGSVEAVCELLEVGLGVPIVRHYKEHACLPWEPERRNLLETSAQVYVNRESFEHFQRLYGIRADSAHLLDADMISAKHMTDRFSLKLRVADGVPHVLIAGSVSASNDRYDVRAICIELDRRRIHTHLYAKFVGLDTSGSIVSRDKNAEETYRRIERELDYVHLHDPVPPCDFTETWSQYDVGMMHARVDDRDQASAFQRLNLGHRYSAYLAAGLPLVVQRGGQDAMERFIQEQEVGLVFEDFGKLEALLRDERMLAELTLEVRARRRLFSFEAVTPTLLQILAAYANTA